MEFPTNLAEANNEDHIRDNDSGQPVLSKQWESNQMNKLFKNN